MDERTEIGMREKDASSLGFSSGFFRAFSSAAARARAEVTALAAGIETVRVKHFVCPVCRTGPASVRDRNFSKPHKC